MAAARFLRAAVLSLGVMAAAPRGLADGGAPAPTLARSSNIVLGVESGLEAGRVIAGMVGPLGGRVVRSSESDAVVEVPSGRYADFVAELRRIGQLENEKLATADVSTQLADALAAVGAAKAARQRRERLGGVARDVNEKLTVERVLEHSASRIVQAEARVRELQARGELVVVQIQFRTEGKESIQPATLPIPWLDELGHGRLANPPEHSASRSIELRAFTDFALALKVDYVYDAEPLDGVHGATSLAFDMRVLGEANPVGLFGGMDVVLGGSRGFVYGLQFLGGAGVPLGRRFAFGVSSGPGIDGITSVVPFGVLFPVELWLTWDLASFMSVSAWGQNAWVLGSDDRQSGSKRALFGDELSVGIAVVPADRDSWSEYTQRRNGWLFGAGYRELMGTAMFELRVGWTGIDADFGGG